MKGAVGEVFECVSGGREKGGDILDCVESVRERVREGTV